MIKRILSLALTAALACALLPASAFAAAQWRVAEVSPFLYDYYDPDGFSEGLMAMKMENGFWGYVDKNGKVVVPGKYYWAEPFHDGLARVGTDRPYYGFIDKTGKEVIPLKYEECSSVFSEGLAVVNDGTGVKMIDTTGKTVIPKGYGRLNAFSEGLAAAAIRGEWGWEWGFIDRNGTVVIPLQYSNVMTGFHNGIAAVTKTAFDDMTKHIGLIDKTGADLTGFIYDGIEPGDIYDGNALIRVKQDDKWGYIDQRGEQVIPCQYDYAQEFSEGFAVVGMDGEPESRWGIINAAGEVAIPLEYRSICDVHDGIARFNVWEDGECKYGYIDVASNEVLVPPQFTWANDFSEGRASVSKKGQGSAVIDTAGNFVVPFGKYASIGGFCCGLANVTAAGVCGMIDRTGREVVPPQYDRMGEIKSSFYDYDRSVELFTQSKALMAAKADGNGNMKYGVIAFEAMEVFAYASTQTVLVDGSPVEFQCYALKDANGNDTNYIKLRDIASVLSGTAAQFNVGWDGAVNIESGKAYTPNGSEMKTPFSGDRSYDEATARTNIDGRRAALDAIVLKDDQGGAYTYYKLRDLGKALGFTVDWTAEKGIFIETT